MSGHGLNLAGLDYGKVASCCEHGNVLSDSIKCWECTVKPA